MIGKEPLCMKCKHLIDDNKMGYRCDAFPIEIPIEIITSVIDHIEPFPGDNDIQYEPAAVKENA